MRLALAVIAAAGLAGCAVDQAREVKTYRDVLDLGRAAAPREAGAPLSLEEAIRLANAQNEQLSIEGEEYLQALIDLQRRAASLMPTLDFFSLYTFRDGDDGGSTGDGEGVRSSRSTLLDGGLRLQYTVLTGGTDLARVRAAGLTAEQRRWLLLDLRESLLLETAQAYYDVLRAERLVEVLNSSAAVQAERLRDILARQRVGFARPLDVAQIEAQASRTRVSLLDAQAAAASARAALALLTGVEVSGVALTDGFSAPSMVPERDDLLWLAYSRRQDLAAGEAAAEAARAEVEAEIGRYYPSVTLNLDYFLFRDTPPTARDWAGLLSVNLPLFSAGRIRADVRDAWSEFRQAVLSYGLSRRQVRSDVETAHNELTAAAQRLDELGRQVEAAAEALRQAEASYGAGLGTNLERVTAQDQLLSAQLALASEEFNLKVAFLAALRAAGVLTEDATGAVVPAAPPAAERRAPESPFIVGPGAGAGVGAGVGAGGAEGAHAEAR